MLDASHVATVLDESVNAIAVGAIAYMAVHGVTAYEPIGAIATIAVGRAYLKRKHA